MAQLENFRLKVFRAVCQHLNFRKAAEQLFLTQPAVTLQIKALENDLGIRLFDRTAHGVKITPNGKILLQYANMISMIVTKAEQQLCSADGRFSGELNLGVSTTIAQYVLPRLIGAFLEEHPRVQLSLHSGNTAEVVTLLINDRVSIALIEGPSRSPGIKIEPFMRDELVLIVPSDSESSQVSPQQLVSSNLLMRERGSGSRQVVQSALEKAGFPLDDFKSVMNLDSTEAIKSGVVAKLGIGFVSRWAISKELELGALKTAQVRGLQIWRHFSLVTRSGPETLGPTKAFRTFALERGRMLSTPTRSSKRAEPSRR